MTMTIVTFRLSETEVQVDQTIHVFDSGDTADNFQQCLGDNALDTCMANHKPSATRAVSRDSATDSGAPGSVISPSLGGMP